MSEGQARPNPSGHLHIPEHAAHVPDLETVKAFHTRMTASDFTASAYPHGHRPYTSTEHGCYLCALLAEIDRLRGLIAKVAQGVHRIGGINLGSEDCRQYDISIHDPDWAEIERIGMDEFKRGAAP